MLFKKGNINKTISATLLLLLLFIHSVKLLHSHPGNTLSKEIHKHNAIIKSGSDCSICNYQLAKDTDALFSDDDRAYIPKTNPLNSPLIEFYKRISYSAFESRGPPDGI